MDIEVSDFTLQNLGTGPERFSLSGVDADFAVLYFQRDHYCTNCRDQVQTVADRYDEFRDRDAEVVSIVPEPAENVREWQDAYDLPYPLLSDPDADVAADYDQPVRFGILGRFSDFLGRMPEVVVVDLRGEQPTIPYVHQGRSTFDRPTVDEILAELGRLRAEPVNE